MTNPDRLWLWIERLAWASGVVALACWTIAAVSGAVGMRQELKRFAALRDTGASATSPGPNQRLWSPERVQAWREALVREGPAPLGVLRIPRIGVEVPVLDGTDDWTLNRGAGHIEDTAGLGSDGNCGIAGHRDGFFRALKDIEAGDLLDVEVPSRLERYRVERTWIVEPEDVSVLDPTPSSALTLVTCYPFYFVGSAPQRFIVRALRVETRARPSQFHPLALLDLRSISRVRK
jgi:sortase A